MNNPTPRRFHFTLSFLLAWVLLTSCLFGITLKITYTTQVDLSWPGPSLKVVHLGWPFETYNIEPINPFDGSDLLNNHAGFEHELLWLGMLANLAVCVVVSLAICVLISFLRRRSSVSSATSVVKNARG